MMNVINGGAHANNNLDLQEFMIIPVGAPSFREARALRRRGVPRAEEDPRRHAACSTAVGDEGGFAPERRKPRGRDPADPRGHRQGRLHRRRADRARPGLRRQRVLQGRQVRARRRRPHADAPRSWTDMLATWVDKYPIISIEDGMAEGDWDGWKHLTERLGKQRAAGGRRPVRHQHEDPAGRHRQGHRQLDPDQDQPDRHADRDLRRHRDGQARGLHRRDQPPLGRDRGHAPSPTSRWAPTPARSRPARCRARTASPSTTSCCASRKTSATSPATPAAPRSTTCADPPAPGAMRSRIVPSSWSCCC